ncbi:unnamed protein product [Cercopithifilaria johnstoni]|uniref:Uncharacterized protein n=1 Tax=Cercopithifilaria johnstoni TaxID=2874296 RepID=A0A8J2PRF2_9BILA|nr:unnamed protein product [Cercopithifilaria johnstoni]
MQDVPISGIAEQIEFEIGQENFKAVGRNDVTPVVQKPASMSGEASDGYVGSFESSLENPAKKSSVAICADGDSAVAIRRV